MTTSDDTTSSSHDHDRAERSIRQATDYLRDVSTYALRYRDPELGKALRAQVDRLFPPNEEPVDGAEVSTEAESSQDESEEEDIDSRTVPLNV